VVLFADLAARFSDFTFSVNDIHPGSAYLLRFVDFAGEPS
jgi:hypothetical protein